MVLLAAFPDAEYEMCQVLPNAVEGLTADTVTPPDWTGHLPFARVTRTGGQADRVTDNPRLTIEVFAATRSAAEAAAASVLQYLTQEGSVGVFDLVTNDVGPRDLAWNDANNPRRFVADYTATTRRTN